jgi:hypothetical protein
MSAPRSYRWPRFFIVVLTIWVLAALIYALIAF